MTHKQTVLTLLANVTQIDFQGLLAVTGITYGALRPLITTMAQEGEIERIGQATYALPRKPIPQAAPKQQAWEPSSSIVVPMSRLMAGR